MKKISSWGLVVAAFLLPLITSAQGAQQAAEEASNFVATLNRVIIFPLIALLSAVAFFVFLWGCAQYIFNATNDQARAQGVQHITFGIIGLVIMLSAFTILSIVANTFGLTDELRCANDPSASGCQDVFVVPNTSVGGSNTGNNTSVGGANTGNNTSVGGANTGR